MVSCKVNNRIVTFDYPLQNGDIVEVVTSKAAHGPSRDWMNIAKSSEARNKIRQWFKKEKREENVARGKLSFDSELKHAGLTLSEITTLGKTSRRCSKKCLMAPSTICTPPSATADFRP